MKATIENKTTSVTTHFKKLTIGINVFIVSVKAYKKDCQFFGATLYFGQNISQISTVKIFGTKMAKRINLCEGIFHLT